MYLIGLRLLLKSHLILYMRWGGIGAETNKSDDGVSLSKLTLSPTNPCKALIVIGGKVLDSLQESPFVMDLAYHKKTYSDVVASYLVGVIFV